MEKIRGYLPKGCSLNPHVARLITDMDVGGEYSYDKKKELWFVKFPNTSLGLSTAARLYCGIIKKGYAIPPNDALRNAVFEHFGVNHFEYLPNEIWGSAIV